MTFSRSALVDDMCEGIPARFTNMPGNAHLYACIDGQQYKYVFRSGTEPAKTLLSAGERTASDAYFNELLEQYLLPKACR